MGERLAAHANAQRQAQQLDRFVAYLRVVVAYWQHDVLEERRRVEEESLRVCQRQLADEQDTLVAFCLDPHCFKT